MSKAAPESLACFCSFASIYSQDTNLHFLNGQQADVVMRFSMINWWRAWKHFARQEPADLLHQHSNIWVQLNPWMQLAKILEGARIELLHRTEGKCKCVAINTNILLDSCSQLVQVGNQERVHEVKCQSDSVVSSRIWSQDLESAVQRFCWGTFHEGRTFWPCTSCGHTSCYPKKPWRATRSVRFDSLMWFSWGCGTSKLGIRFGIQGKHRQTTSAVNCWASSSKPTHSGAIRLALFNFGSFVNGLLHKSIVFAACLVELPHHVSHQSHSCSQRPSWRGVQDHVLFCKKYLYHLE